MEEVECVETFIKNLLGYQWNGSVVRTEHIGVIAPYKKQCEKVIEMNQRNNWNNILVGGAEIFQGKLF